MIICQEIYSIYSYTIALYMCNIIQVTLNNKIAECMH